MPAETEEVVIGPDPGNPDHLPHDAASLGLFTVLGRFPRAAQGRGREGIPVKLAMDRDGKPVEDHPVRRDGMSRQRCGGMGAYPFHVHPGSGDVSDQRLPTGEIVTQRHRGPCHSRGGAEDRLDLTKFDAEAAQLDLGVVASDEVEASLSVQADQVAGAVTTATVRPRDETGGRQAGFADVPAGETRTADVELADHTRGDGTQGGVQHLQSRAVHGFPDRHGDPVGTAETVPGSEDRGLGGSVEINQWVAPRHSGGELCGEGFPRQHQGHILRDARGVQGQREGSDHEGVGDAQPRPLGHQSAARVAVFVGDQCAGGTGQQPHRHLEHVRVEPRGGRLRHDGALPHTTPQTFGGHHVGDPRVGDVDPLGTTGGSGGVDDVGAGVGEQGRTGAVGDRGDGGQQIRDAGVIRDDHALPVPAGRIRCKRDDDSRRGVLDHHPLPFVRVAPVDRLPHGPQQAHPEECRHLVHSARKRARDHVLERHAPAAQQGGPAAGTFVKLRPRPPILPRDQRDGLRVVLHLRVPQGCDRGAADGCRTHHVGCLSGQQDIAFGQRRIGAGGNLSQHGFQPMDQPFGVLGTHLRRVFEDPCDSVRATGPETFGEGPHQLETRGGRRGRLLPNPGQVWKFQGGSGCTVRGVVGNESALPCTHADQDVDPGGAPGFAVRVQGLNDAIKSETGVPHRRQIALPQLRNQFRERPTRIDLTDENDRVHEWSHHVCQPGFVARTDGGTHAETSPRTETGQHHRHRRVQDDKRCRPKSLRQGQHRLVNTCIDVKRDVARSCVAVLDGGYLRAPGGNVA